MLAFTSGSTDCPRAVELTHDNLLSNLEALLEIRRVTPEDALLSMLPPCHLFELMCGFLAPLACGARIVYPGTLLPNRLVETIRTERITHALAVPALLSALAEEVLDSPGEPAADPARFASWMRHRIGDDFRTLAIGGAALDPDWKGLLETLLPPQKPIHPRLSGRA